MTEQASILGGQVLGGQALGALDSGYATQGFAPWHLSGIRIDGLSASGSLSPVIPGASRTYDLTFAPQPARGASNGESTGILAQEPDTGHIDRYREARAYLVRAPDVLIIDPPGAGVYYREQYQGGLSALARLEPLQADHDGSYISGDPPPGRDSIHTGRWVVITGPSDPPPVPLPETVCRLTIEATTIGATEDPGPASSAPVYATREDALAAAERNGLTQ